MMDWLSLVSNLIGILGAIFSLFAWIKARQIQQEIECEKKRQNKKIFVTLQNDAEQLELPVELLRSELTRSEVLGRIGMIPMREKGKRFSIGYVNTPEFLRQINQILARDGDAVLTIPCDPEELEQFAVSRNHQKQS